MSEELQQLYNYYYGEIKKAGTTFYKQATSVASLPDSSYRRVIFAGMGGSGISANYIRTLASQTAPIIDTILVKGYQLPMLRDSDLVVITSYSGNTEETLTMAQEAVDHGMQPVCIASGGKLQQFAEDHDLQFAAVPAGLQPRAAFPFLLGTVYGLLQQVLHLPDLGPIEQQLTNTSAAIDEQKLTSIAKALTESYPIILTGSLMEPVGIRCRCQLNENSKLTAGHFVAPEYSHNGIVGLDGIITGKVSMLQLRSSLEHPRAKIHLDFLQSYETELHLFSQLQVADASLLISLLTLTWQVDFISIKAAELQQINPNSIEGINKLKAILKETKA